MVIKGWAKETGGFKARPRYIYFLNASVVPVKQNLKYTRVYRQCNV